MRTLVELVNKVKGKTTLNGQINSSKPNNRP